MKLLPFVGVLLCPLAALAQTTVPSVLSPTGKWISEQEPQWQSSLQNEVTAPFEKARGELKKEYLAALESQFAAATRNAQLNDAVAFRAEREQISGGAEVPAEDAAADPAGLKTLRANYHRKLAALEAQRLASAKSALGRIDTVLAQNQALLTQRQRVDEALELKAKREQLSAAWRRLQRRLRHPRRLRPLQKTSPWSRARKSPS